VFGTLLLLCWALGDTGGTAEWGTDPASARNAAGKRAGFGLDVPHSMQEALVHVPALSTAGNHMPASRRRCQTASLAPTDAAAGMRFL
jgi:hypothetical protein